MNFKWQKIKIGDICDTISDTYKKDDKKVILINTSDIFDGKILNQEIVENKNIKGQFKKTFKKNDILYSEIRPKNRRFAFVNVDDTSKYIASTKLMILRAKMKYVLPMYLYKILTSSQVIDELQHLAETRSGTFPQITFSSELAPICVNIPDLETQKNILEFINPIDDKIELNNQINKNLEQQAQAIFKNLFIEKDNDNRRTCYVNEYFDISIGKTPPRKEKQWFSMNNNDIKWASISDMANCGVYILKTSEYLTKAAIDKFNVVIVPEDVVILSFKLTVGRVAITSEPMVTNEAIAHFKTDNKFINPYLYCYLKNFDYYSLGNTSSIATAVNSKIIRRMKFIVPTNEELLKFNKFAIPAFNTIKLNQQEIQNLIDIRDSLLPKLMSGEIDVSKINI